VSECLVQVKSQSVGKAMADQMRTVSLERFGWKLGTLETSDLQRVEAVVRLQLGLS